MAEDRTGIKICGLSRREDIEAVNRLRPGYVGFIFWEKSRRAVTPQQARILRQLLDPEIVSVGVFVDASPEEAADLAAEGTIGMVQLHGGETEPYIRVLRRCLAERGRPDVPVMKAFTVTGREDLIAAAESSADYVLLDSGKGTGRRFDWSLVQNSSGEPVLQGRRWFLAGGLSPENVGEAILRLHPFGVDLNSGVETEGSKDPEKIRAAIDAVRRADESRGTLKEAGRDTDTDTDGDADRREGR